MGPLQMGRQGQGLLDREGRAVSVPARTGDQLFKQGTKGLSAPAIKNKLALRCSLTGSIFLDNVKLGHDALLPNGQGLAAPFGCLNSARYVWLLSVTGRARFTLAIASVFRGESSVPSKTALRAQRNMLSSESSSADRWLRSSWYKRSL